MRNEEREERVFAEVQRLEVADARVVADALRWDTGEVTYFLRNLVAQGRLVTDQQTYIKNQQTTNPLERGWMCYRLPA